MAERVFAAKLQGVGFENVWVGGHRPSGIEEASYYPLFTEEVIELMRQTLPPERHDHVATGVVVKARKPAERDARGAGRGVRGGGYLETPMVEDV
jgi:ribosomal protein L19E